MLKSRQGCIWAGVLISPILMGTLLPSAASAQAADLTGKDLVDAITAVQSFVPKDQFDTPPDGPAWAGRRFSYTVAPIGWIDRGKTSCAGMPEWMYYNGNLDVSLWGSFMGLGSFPGQSGVPGSRGRKVGLLAEPTIYSVQCSRSPIEDYRASNTFGAQLNVEKWTETAIGIVDASRSDEKFKKYWEKPMDGPTARDLTRTLNVRVSGTLATWPNGRSIACGSFRVEPDIKTPLDKTVKACAFYGRIEMVEFVDGRTGELLYSAKRASR